MNNTEKEIIAQGENENFGLSVGARIEKQRKRKGLTQQQVADYLGLSNSKFIHEYESGLRTPKSYYIAKLAKLFECSTDYLLGLTYTESFEINERVACEYTGLSSDAMKTLADIEWEDKKTIDKLLACAHNSKLFSALDGYKYLIDLVFLSDIALEKFPNDELAEFFNLYMKDAEKELKVFAYDVNAEFNSLLNEAFGVEECKKKRETNFKLICERLEIENGNICKEW